MKTALSTLLFIITLAAGAVAASTIVDPTSLRLLVLLARLLHPIRHLVCAIDRMLRPIML